MKIIVLVKVVPKKVEFDKDKKRLKRSQESMINPSDYFALGAAIELKNKFGFNVHAVSMAPPNSKDLLVKLYDYGVDQIFLLSDSLFANSDVFATSNVLTNFINKFDSNYDYIFAGNFSSDGLTGVLPGEIASKLSIFYFSNVVAVDYQENHLIIEKANINQIIRFRIEKKALLSFTDKGMFKALPNLYYAFESKEKTIEILSNDTLKLSTLDVGTEGSKTSIKDIFEIKLDIQNDLIKENGSKVITEILLKEVLNESIGDL
ncbi:electron transfer flavoprotein subunit beta/FixA family protein [Caldisericum exile]